MGTTEVDSPLVLTVSVGQAENDELEEEKHDEKQSRACWVPFLNGKGVASRLVGIHPTLNHRVSLSVPLYSGRTQTTWSAAWFAVELVFVVHLLRP